MRQTKSVILVVAGVVQPEVGGLGNPPGDFFPGGEGLLGTDGCSPRTLEKRVGISSQPERRHQVFEHRPGPGEQDGPSAIQGVGAAKQEPAFLRNVLLRNGHKNSGTGFGAEQVITGSVEMIRIDIEPDGNEVASLVEEASEIHFLGKLAGDFGEPAQVLEQANRVVAGHEQLASKTFIEAALRIRGTVAGPLTLGEKLVNEFRDLLQGQVVHQFEVEFGILAQGGKFRRMPGSVVLNRALDLANSQL